jgi:hypothetical protein
MPRAREDDTHFMDYGMQRKHEQVPSIGLGMVHQLPTLTLIDFHSELLSQIRRHSYWFEVTAKLAPHGEQADFYKRRYRHSGIVGVEHYPELFHPLGLIKGKFNSPSWR